LTSFAVYGVRRSKAVVHVFLENDSTRERKILKSVLIRVFPFFDGDSNIAGGMVNWLPLHHILLQDFIGALQPLIPDALPDETAELR